jgi:hypothetical protein
MAMLLAPLGADAVNQLQTVWAISEGALAPPQTDFEHVAGEPNSSCSSWYLGDPSLSARRVLPRS